ncbi:substrate-binding periplasmic protein [Marinibactrum halimedae]|uniref:substrate-binding periplasmic protein n=1 Tax=Marinibactrum halimedae TaxID=1444977 RepID=UPI001E3BFF47|nr:transporter substrate-binding domain-containing protein [Marinibactrum halimedae]MCD9461092.1 transporter substrate-binding domain-containing protein [Marinibactrum halimedae]
MSSSRPLDSPDGQYLYLVYNEAFRRLGIKLHYVYVPSKRALSMVYKGEVDGEISRGSWYGHYHPLLVRIEESHWENAFVAVVNDPKIQLDGWESLRGTEYRVSCSTGTQICDANLPKLIRSDQLRPITRSLQGLKMLLANRTDVLILSETRAQTLINHPELPTEKLYIAGVLGSFYGYAYLHKRYRHIVPKVSVVLKNMKEEGLLNQYWKKVGMKELLKSRQTISSQSINDQSVN